MELKEMREDGEAELRMASLFPKVVEEAKEAESSPGLYR